jgi:hypothetical protein
MSSAGFKPMIPAIEWPQTIALECMVTRIGCHTIISLGLTLFQLFHWWWLYSVLEIMNGEEVRSEKESFEDSGFWGMALSC